MDNSSKRRPMRYPYTITAEIAQFPYMYYIKKSWLLKYFLINSVLLSPLYWILEKKSITKERVKLSIQHREKVFADAHARING